MIQRHIDRSRSTRGGLAASFAIHACFILLLGVLVGQQAGVINQNDELTEIAYIEATYGQAVAAKVQIKEKPVSRPEPRGRGVNTDSAVKPAANDPVESPRPQPKAQKIEQPMVVEAPLAKVEPQVKPQPRLQQASTPKPRLKVAVQSQPKSKPAVAKVDIKVPDTNQKAPARVLSQASQLETRAPRPKTRKVVRTDKQYATASTQLVSDVSAPKTSSRAKRETFTPQSGGLNSKSGQIAATNVDIAARTTRDSNSGTINDGPAASSAGGSLKSAERSSYSAPAAGLKSATTSRNSRTGSGVVDVSGPSGNGGGKKSGRKTILNYGSGGGGRGGALSSRQRIAEPEEKSQIVAQADPVTKPKTAVSEVKLGKKGVNMTITGQISGRQILHSVAPEYTALAKKKGWEGVVAVHFTVLPSGRVKDNMYFDQTSVHRDLNKAAMAAVKKFRFAALGNENAAVEQWGVITIVFRLN